jgi:hypothetical protein
MNKLTKWVIVIGVLWFACDSIPQSAVAQRTAVWTGSGDPLDVRHPANWSWPDGPPTGIPWPIQDTDVILDHTAVSTTLDFSFSHLECNSAVVGNGTDSVSYNVVSFPHDGFWGMSMPNGFVVNDRATIDFKNMHVRRGVVLAAGSTLRVEEDGHLFVTGGQEGLLDVRGNLELVLPAEPSGEYVIAQYGRLTGRFDSVVGLPPGWRIDYGSGTDDAIRAVAEPSSLAALVGMGMVGLAVCGWRRRRRRRATVELQ